MPLTIFISYVHEDSAIASGLSNMLNNAFGADITVFLDRVKIQQGENIPQSIAANLEKSDVLAIVSTGIDRKSHDWAGYELGFFRAKHEGHRDENALWGRVVTFCLAGQAPRPNALDKYVQLDEKPTVIPIADDDDLFILFKELHLELTHNPLDLNKLQSDIYKQIIAQFRTDASTALMQRPKTVYRPQKQLVIHYDSAANLRAPYVLSTNATIELRGGSGAVFGVLDNDPKPKKWEDFCKSFRQHPLASFWIGSIVRALLGGNEIGAENSYLISSADGTRLYRLVLTSVTTYHNGTVEAGIYLIEVLRRAEYGDPRTTLLAKGLHLITRFRSLFLENTSPFQYLNVSLSKDGTALADLAAHIIYELDILNSDQIEAKLDKPAAWNGILSPDDIAAYASVWMPIQAELISNCGEAILAVDAASIDDAKKKLAATLIKTAQQIGPINDMTLEVVAKRLLAVAGERGGHEAAIPVPPPLPVGPATVSADS